MEIVDNFENSKESRMDHPWSVSDNKRHVALKDTSIIAYNFDYKITEDSIIEYTYDGDETPDTLCLIFKDSTELCSYNTKNRHKVWKVGRENKLGETTQLIVKKHNHNRNIGNMKVYETFDSELYDGCYERRNIKSKKLEKDTFYSCRRGCLELGYHRFSFQDKMNQCTCISRKQNKRNNLSLFHTNCDCITQSVGSTSLCVYHIQPLDRRNNLSVSKSVKLDNHIESVKKNEDEGLHATFEQVFPSENIDDLGNYEPVRVIIKVKKEHWQEASSLLHKYSETFGIQIKRTGILSATIPKKKMTFLEEHPKIDQVEIDYLLAEMGTSDGLGRTLGIKNPYGVPMVLQDERFWKDLGEPKGEIRICVADTGIDKNHIDIPDDIIGKNNPAYDDEVWYTDLDGHGKYIFKGFYKVLIFKYNVKGLIALEP